MRKITAKFSIFEMIVIALTAALGMASKPLIGPVVKLITGPLNIPGGALAGGLYMMFLILAYGLTRRLYSGTLTALIQAFLVVITGMGGGLGVVGAATYLPPGIAVDSVMLIFALCGQPRTSALPCFFACMAANLTGTFMMWGVVFGMPFSVMPPAYVLLAFSASALSGGLGGLLAYCILKQVRRRQSYEN